MEATDTNLRLWAIVYNSLVRHIDVARALHSTWRSSTPGWRRYILPIIFRSGIDGSRRELEVDKKIDIDE